ncbi:aminoglycoside N(3)-acetyltransferase [Actinopolymorpha rutila]|uniref:Aminoglycoside N(3)-acetyltransferase n=1 Tax=Actinopolymorpha rutila TaxID=446787 RepID=A0A852ZPX6_9ACTN|nr:AAC(3) family N-acetyltransferase [Actinopolymorpha rutila]NYH93582.1 aminoglycoside 3-N-acetyltransferase [Actinopolymorpha rutila]
MAFVTVERLAEDLRDLGVAEGSVVLAHVSLSRIGRVVGGEQAVIEALLRVLGESGTLVMPSQSWQLCDPAYLNDPDVPREAWQLVRDHLPAYDPAVTPSRTMGKVAELFRAIPGAVRSAHPHRSFAALGPRAAEIVAVHDLDSPNGERSPLKTMYELDARTLLLGVGHSKSTILHLAEHRSGTLADTVPNGAPLLIDGERRWVEYEEIIVHDHDFDDVGSAFAKETGLQRTGQVGDATALLVPHRPLVDYAARWFAEHRNAGASVVASSPACQDGKPRRLG